MRRLLAFTPVPRARMALAVGLGALTIAFGAGLMATAGYLISRAAERPAILSLGVAIVGVRFFGIARPLARYAERLASHDAVLRALGPLRVRAYRRIEPLAPVGLGGYRDGDLLARTVADVDAVGNLHLRGTVPSLVALLAGALSVGVTAAFLPAAGVVLAGGLLAGGIAVPLVSAAIGRKPAARQAAARGELSAQLVELTRAAPELVAYGAEDERLERLREADAALTRMAARDAFAGGVGEGLGLLVTGLTVAGVAAVSVAANAGGELDRVLVAALALLALASFEAVQPLPAALRELLAALAAGRRVLDLTSRRPAVQDPDVPMLMPAAPYAIALEGVTARYAAGERPPLDAFDLRLEPGRRVALTGPSGAGKTTVVNLLERFLDPEAGSVTLAGCDLRDYRQEDVRAAFAVAGQDSYLFSASIRENVRIGRPGASDAEVERALRQAKVWSFVESLPDGLETLVGEEGRELSGGQRQRVALARALIAEAPVLVLDEPTAHLDEATARAFVEDVLSAAGGRSVLLITHRPEGLELVDEIVELAA